METTTTSTIKANGTLSLKVIKTLANSEKSIVQWLLKHLQ